MDETPEELEQIRRDAAAIDVHRYQKRFRALKAIALGALLAALTELVLLMVDSRRNPCERVRDHFCNSDPTSAACQMYKAIWAESVEDDNPAMRGNIRSQCQSKIDRLKGEDGVEVK
jgi:hypothetical protein